MKRLEEKIKLRGLGYDVPIYATLIKRTPEKAIYEVGHPYGQKYYEVFRIRKGIGKFLPSGSYKPAGEIYPSNEAFGDWAWCIRDMERALEKYDEL